MSGPEHYRKAEQLLDGDIMYRNVEGAPNRLAEAQVHATLALAAATAWGATRQQLRQWADVAGPRSPSGPGGQQLPH